MINKKKHIVKNETYNLFWTETPNLSHKSQPITIEHAYITIFSNRSDIKHRHILCLGYTTVDAELITINTNFVYKFNVTFNINRVAQCLH